MSYRWSNISIIKFHYLTHSTFCTKIHVFSSNIYARSYTSTSENSFENTLLHYSGIFHRQRLSISQLYRVFWSASRNVKRVSVSKYWKSNNNNVSSDNIFRRCWCDNYWITIVASPLLRGRVFFFVPAALSSNSADNHQHGKIEKRKKRRKMLEYVGTRLCNVLFCNRAIDGKGIVSHGKVSRKCGIKIYMNVYVVKKTAAVYYPSYDIAFSSLFLNLLQEMSRNLIKKYNSFKK